MSAPYGAPFAAPPSLAPTLTDALRSTWWLVVGLAVLGGALGYGLAARQTAQYTTTGTIILGPGGYTTQSVTNDPSQRVNTLAAVAQSDLVLQPAAESTSTSLDTLRKDVTATPSDKSDVITLTVVAPSPDRGVAIAQAVEAAFVSKTTLAQESTPGAPLARGAKPVRPTSPVQFFTVHRPTSQSAPLPKRDGALGAVAGLLLGAFLSWLFRGELTDAEREVRMRKITATTYTLVPPSPTALTAAAPAGPPALPREATPAPEDALPPHDSPAESGAAEADAVPEATDAPSLVVSGSSTQDQGTDQRDPR